jgi:hypothetical protein
LDAFFLFVLPGVTGMTGVYCYNQPFVEMGSYGLFAQVDLEP